MCRRIEGNIVEVVGGEDSDEDQDTSDFKNTISCLKMHCLLCI